MKSRDSKGVSRREMLKMTAGAAVVMPNLQTPARRRRPGRRPHQFFTRAEFLMVDELSELIIPEDDHSPGARAAKVAEFLDQTLAESPDQPLKQQWREGLKLIDSLAREMHGAPLMRISGDQRITVLEQVARNEGDPQTAGEKFFGELKSRVAYGYYTSKIGLRQELEYKGNTYLREFVGEV
ncbi:MAG TPA: gluconate 2-dehydrogenase subunit 3 family protein [Blastocatellia bacterium]|nr:gluconate 2-dehydrogenase subunit 3 family protein [Blastocatellia bacterium]